MATLDELVTQISAAVTAIPGGTRSRMGQDYGTDTAEFSALGTTRFQIQATLLNRADEDSAGSREIAQIEVILHHALSRLSDEQAYTSGQMVGDQSALLRPSFWEGLGAVLRFPVDGGPVVNQSPERTGKRITYSVGVQLVLAP